MVNFTLNSKLIYLHIEMVYSILFWSHVKVNVPVAPFLALAYNTPSNPISKLRVTFGAFKYLLISMQGVLMRERP